MNQPIPFLDLAAQHDEIRQEVDRAWRAVTAADAFIGGRYVEQFETEFATYCAAEHCIGVGNGTDALELIFAGLGVGAGDEVIVPANTFVATVSAVVAVGATPVFIDVDPDTLLVTADLVADAITPATAAVAVVHLYGQMPDMPAIARVTDRAGIALVEDAAQAHGAEWAGRRAGSFGRAAAFSFYPGKNLGAFGDGGAVLTSDAALARTVRSLANHGRSADSRYLHDLIGGNSRLDGLQASILSVKLRRLDGWNAGRREASARYHKLLAGSSCDLLAVDPRATHVHHLEVVRVPDRDRMTSALDRSGIGWGLHYPIPAHRQPSFAAFAPGPLLVTETAATQILSLPMYPTMGPGDVDRVCESIDDALHFERVVNPPQPEGASSLPVAVAGADPVLAVIDFEPTRVALRPIDFVRYSIYALIIIALGATSGYLVANLGDPVYGARSEILFERRTEQSTGFLREDRNLTTQLVTLRTRAVLGPVAAANGMTVDELAKKLHVGIVGSSEILRLQIDDSSRRRALTILAAVSKEYLSRANSPATTETQAYLEEQLAKVNAELARLTERVSRVPAQQALIQAQITSLLDQRTELNGRLEEVQVDFINRPRVAEITQPYAMSDPVSPKPLNGAVAGGLAGVVIAAITVAILARRRGQSVRST